MQCQNLGATAHSAEIGNWGVRTGRSDRSGVHATFPLDPAGIGACGRSY